MAGQFKPGDQVQLKSGGPVMTVVGDSDTTQGDVLCRWFDDKNVVQEHTFTDPELKTYERPSVRRTSEGTVEIQTLNLIRPAPCST